MKFFAKMHLMKKFMPIDYDEEQILEYQSKLGNSDSQLQLAICYFNKNNFEKFIEYATLSANSGNSNAMWLLALYNEDNNEYESNHWYEEAAKNGDLYSQYKLGAFCFFGINGYNKNIDMAKKWLLVSANRGFCKSICLLIDLYTESFYSIPKDRRHNEDFQVAQQHIDVISHWCSEVIKNGDEKQKDYVRSVISELKEA